VIIIIYLILLICIMINVVVDSVIVILYNHNIIMSCDKKDIELVYDQIEREC